MRRINVLNTTEGEKLRFTTYGDSPINSKNCLIFVHGFKGFKDWGFVPYIGNYFADRGYFVITFNFSHNGIADDPLEFTDLDRFAKNTFSREIKELSEIIDAYKNNYFGEIGNTKIGLVGHSRGGAISLLTAKQKNEVASVAVWASVARLDRYSERQKEEWRKKGSFEVMNMRTKQIMRLDVSLLDDLEKHKDDLLNIELAVRNLDRPLLIAHGEQDLAVPVKEAGLLYEWSDKSKTEFFIMNSAGHTFDAKHPFEGTNEKIEKLLNKTLIFFNNNL